MINAAPNFLVKVVKYMTLVVITLIFCPVDSLISDDHKMVRSFYYGGAVNYPMSYHVFDNNTAVNQVEMLFKEWENSAESYFSSNNIFQKSKNLDKAIVKDFFDFPAIIVVNMNTVNMKSLSKFYKDNLFRATAYYVNSIDHEDLSIKFDPVAYLHGGRPNNAYCTAVEVTNNKNMISFLLFIDLDQLKINIRKEKTCKALFLMSLYGYFYPVVAAINHDQFLKEDSLFDSLLPVITDRIRKEVARR